MSKINILAEDLRNQIAAGEVVERPASVLKELMENSVDSGASQIEVNLLNGGVDLIEVKDNGEGISKEDMLLSVTRHATSKIKQKSDLFNIASFGFRGEALASIASVSIFSIKSKQADSPLSYNQEVHAGKIQDLVECAVNDGTQVRVEDLFISVPVRKKFLKTFSTEFKKCVEVFEAQALSNPHIAMSLSHDNKSVYDLASASLEDRLAEIVNDNVFANLLSVKNESREIAIRGYVSKPGVAYKSRSNQKFFVNGRLVNSKIISAALKDAYHSYLEKTAFPAAYLFIDVVNDIVDVNVHPQKSEVRFLKEHDVFRAIRETVKSAFTLSSNSVSSIDQGQGLASFITSSNTQFVNPRPSYSSNYSFKQDTNNTQSNLFQTDNSFPSSDFKIYSQDSSEEQFHYRLIGQAANKFIILETESKVIFLDQHAVHERARYDKYLSAYKNKSQNTQKLLIPEILNLSASDFVSVQSAFSLLSDFGFELSEIGKNTIQVSAVPEHVGLENLQETILTFLSELDSRGDSRVLDEKLEKALTYLSCRGSVMFGDKLTETEMIEIINMWRSVAKGLTCPHGRPLGFEMSIQELERKVGR